MKFLNLFNASPNFLKDSNASLKMKTMKKVRVHSLVHSTSRVGGTCWNSGMGTTMSDKQINYSYGPT
jgi:hypothetical protein